MSYLLECQVCNHRIEVTDPATLVGTQCPECASFYALRPVDVRPKVVLRGFAFAESAAPAPPPRVSPDLASDPVPANTADWRADETAAAPVAARTGPPAGFGSDSPHEAARAGIPVGILEPGPGRCRTAAKPVSRPQPAVRRVPLPARSEYEPPEPSPVLVAAGPAALLLGAAAVACACVAALDGVAVPLCVLGVLVGLVGVVVDDGTDRSRLVPTAAAAACGVLLVVLVFPGVGAAFRLGRSAGAVDPTAVRVVPLAGDTLDPGADEDGWVDASRAAVQQNRVGIQVVSARLGPSGGPTVPGQPPAAPKQVLVVRLRVQRIWGGEQTLRDEPGAEDRPPPQQAPATLTDDTGKVCQLLPAAAWDAAPSRTSRAGGEVTFAFEAPSPGFKFLRLELAAAAWGGTGSFRFKIPSSMTRPEPPRGGRPAARGGA